MNNNNAALNFIKKNATLIALVVLAIGMGMADDSFFTARNLSNLARQVTIIGIIAVGMTMVILISGIDLSVGSVAGLAAVVVTVLMQNDINVWISIILTLAVVGGLIGAWNGFWIAHYRIPPFIITLGMLTIARGLALTISDGSAVPVTDLTFPELGGAYIPAMPSTVIIIGVFALMLYSMLRSAMRAKALGGSVDKVQLISNLLVAGAGLALALYIFGSYNGIPVPVAVFAVIAGVGIYILGQTRFGRRLYALGGNEDAARLSGIDVYKTKLIVYITVSVLSALAGILLASRLNGASPNLGTMFELDAIASVVIGGTSLSGGSGTIGGTVIGALIIGVLNNGMSLLGVSAFYQLIIKGFIIILAVWFDVLQKRK